MGALSASLRLGPAGRGGAAAAAWQTLVRISTVLACCCLMPVMTCGGMPHQTELSSAYFIILASAAENALNNPQASCAVTLRSLAVRIAAAFLPASSRSFMNSLTQGGSCCGAAGGWNCAAAVATAPGTRHAAINNARRKFMNWSSPDPRRIIADWRAERTLIPTGRMRREHGNPGIIGGPRQGRLSARRKPAAGRPLSQPQ